MINETNDGAFLFTVDDMSDGENDADFEGAFSITESAYDDNPVMGGGDNEDDLFGSINIDDLDVVDNGFVSTEGEKVFSSSTGEQHMQKSQQSVSPANPFPATTTTIAQSSEKSNKSPYQQISVSKSRFIPSSNLFTSSTVGGYWLYKFTAVYTDRSWSPTQVERRFSHIVALERRLRESCPGSILPPRPGKKNTFEEAGLVSQSSEFADTRSHELQLYMSSLAQHPYASSSVALHVFLTQPDIGGVWKELSDRAFTRLGAMGNLAAKVITEKTSMVFDATIGSDAVDEIVAGFNSSGLLGADDTPEYVRMLPSAITSEKLRLANVSESLPKIINLEKITKETNETKLALGMEANKCSKHIKRLDPDISIILDTLSAGFLRDGRCSKRSSIQLASQYQIFETEYKCVDNVKAAISDYISAQQKLIKAKNKADEASAHLLREQTFLLTSQQLELLDKMEKNVERCDEYSKKCQEEVWQVGKVLMEEIHRVDFAKRKNWILAVQAMAKEFKESCEERTKIWEGTEQQFKRSFEK